MNAMTAIQLTEKEMLRAMRERDTSYDGVFFTCVKTTGIFCRPSCSARKPLERNVEFKTSVQECLLAGYRPCLRCRPLAAGRDAPEWLDRVLKRIESAPNERITDADLAAIDVSPHAARRYFKRRFGLSFQAYHRARRMGLALQHIQSGGSDAEAACDHGYESLSGFREAFQKTFGATPVKSRELTRVLTRTIDSPIGPLVACATDDAVCLLDFADRRGLQRQIQTLNKRLHAAIAPGVNDVLRRLETEILEYFACERSTFTVPLHRPGTPFQTRVWNKLAAIPYGRTQSYEQVAESIGQPRAQRAVGRACGDNPIAIVVPCHRVVRRDGSLSGYGGGLWRKQFLLELERKSDVLFTQRRSDQPAGLLATRRKA
ncbi:MAG: bifunctional transcriptional activator/DNA repair protein Ada [Phycisphaerales bacterium]|nr:bifunctional transcriptional activator/DNA repair protein Ada [Phycisphaerales bacterium]